jgi:transcriptional regulator with XRE-family HTH domain
MRRRQARETGGVDSSAELGEYLKARRAQRRPDDVGLPPAGPGRRVAGLRREEVAQLAGMSADYYTRLEQGRHLHPSDSVLSAVAGVLGLGPAERAHLFDLARRTPPATRRGNALGVQRVRPGVRNLIESITDQPAFVVGRRADVLATNRLMRALVADFDAMPARDRNVARWTILDPAARDLYPDWAAVAAEVVGSLRLDAGRYPDDPRTAELVGELAMKSEDFRRWWASHRVAERAYGAKRMHHQLVGDLEIDYEAMTLPADPDQTLFIYSTRPGSRSREAMQLLASWNDTPHTAERSPARQPHSE